ncbi:MAG: FkbM family methyltransferase [bacterium]
MELTKNYGYFTYSFEPSPETYKILKCNVILSDIENKINIFNYALGNQNTEMMFDYNWDNDASSKIIQDINNESK